MLLTESPSFKCFESFFLPYVTQNTVSAAKYSLFLFCLQIRPNYDLNQQQGEWVIELIALEFELLHR